MRISLTIIAFLTAICCAFGQDKMIVEKPFRGSTFYGDFSEHIDSLSELPSVIQFNLQGYLKRTLGAINDSVTFSHGQIVDLEGKFDQDSVTYNRGWIVPKYDLKFLLKDNSIGIHSYYLNIQLDSYGQILKCNWPKKSHSKRSQFIPRTEIERFALKRAELKGLDSLNYEVDFNYSEKHDKLCWIFKFPVKTENNRREFNLMEVTWNHFEIVREYIISESTVN